MRPTPLRLLTPWLLCLALAACAYPRTVRVVDAECQIERRQMVLELAELTRVRGCVNEGCVVQLLGEAAVLVTSTVVSGSIVLVGNIVYWLEARSACRRLRAKPPAAPASIPQ